MGNLEKLTPMMKQYMGIKEKYKDAILLFRLGDFYEAFFEDAEIISKVLNIVLTKRQNAPMAGIPYHALDNYLKKLVESGYKVAICEQMEDASQAKGIVKREVTRVITPGTIIEDELLSNDNNYLMAVIFDEKYVSAFIDVSTGELFLKSFDTFLEFVDFVKISSISQVICSKELFDKLKEEIPHLFVEELDEWYFQGYEEKIKETYGLFSIEHLEITELEKKVLGALFKYLEYTLMENKPPQKPKRLEGSKYMILDSKTVENLSLIPGEKGKNLFDILNKTKTSMGARLLKKWILQPLKEKKEILERQKLVEAFYNDHLLLNEVREYLSGVYDLERILTRLGYGKVSPKDLVSLKRSLYLVPSIKDALRTNENLVSFAQSLNEFNEVVGILEKALYDEPSNAPGDGNVIKGGYSVELDDYRNLLFHSEEKLKEFQESEREKTGIQKLRVGFNQVFGYYIEVPKGQVKNVPDYYIRKQTLVNSERYITQELKEFEEKIMSAREKVELIEKSLFEELKQKLSEYIDGLRNLAQKLSELDAISNLAMVARLYGYTKPKFTGGEFYVKNARHAVVERYVSDFVANDIYMDDRRRMYIVTGPNMSGKSTYIRQVGLIAVMAQIGSFVPADDAEIPIFDRVFTRMGARDDISTGKSTFLIEMSEVALILEKATKKSLVLLDEVGRGTSTFDGISIAWAMSEYIYNEIGCETMFATHFTELTELSDVYEGIKNLTIEVRETNNGVVFLHKVVEGIADRSYGIEVAQIAGVPDGVVERAKEILDIISQKSELEKKVRVLKEGQLKKIKSKKKIPEGQLSLFEVGDIE
ncbi:DNA mismatch repair protein MutS [Thermosipho melanesiensis]|uniref:DNA mismatch repair protein MutS n=1 Tax=Thermosipho melanesiensis (strain DSM 12029 / CIP 104789 / BI429) TaxID=391009 RepID=MUTS_THEM4|nr:DNA mismatch repair protein MutS [Thermosipho melanesiensis]A6LLR1.1 RecName: Full=DNA mismatch repair protein MutS [Thermosipho melanesiensis BI429]ABR30862.1 DNA mismatch repair protein MutS [Thermosipho melanesiensis BI429]OOC36775.1 DNA mismatch repair protein MutS [Thermosipho melanesiensis]OOC38476.1 DNA mismatch repair protein MutS [Thermosipho melanesiensis]OOC38938.1 DNA mismatch repair protein MutS [Thermosipho melanesiensis]OOC41576.1 DNA mismatch repair protein MutS [Thermosiph